MKPRIVIAPDSFKGSLTAAAAAQAMQAGIRRYLPDADICCCPLADGGEGTLLALQAARGGELLHFPVQDLAGRAIDAPALLQGDLLLLESAQVAGLAQAAGCVPELRSSAGLGQLLRHGLERGLRRFHIGLGGTGSNDGGVGMLAQFGLRLFDLAGNRIEPLPANLQRLHRADFSRLDRRLFGAELLVLSDVDAPLTGPRGATYVFGPQKGIAAQQLAQFDAALAHWAGLADAWAGRPLAQQPGAGAAGGIGHALLLLGARLVSGGRYVAGQHDLQRHIAAADWVLTGEGRSDMQTLGGKLPLVVAGLGLRSGVPVTLLSGAIERAALAQLAPHFAGCFSPMLGPADEEGCKQHAAQWLADMAEQLARLRWRNL